MVLHLECSGHRTFGSRSCGKPLILLWTKTVRVLETAPDTSCRQRLRNRATAAAVVIAVVEQAAAATAYVSIPGCEIP